MCHLNYLKDKRSNCHSIILNLSIKDYMDLIDEAYKENGGISGQRPVLTTKSAQQIRKIMVGDFKNGAVLPPVVIGIIDNNCSFDDSLNMTKFLDYLNCIDKSAISIIDGMQRTTAMKEANLADEDKSARKIRVEFWIVKEMNDLIYRMLVLNTGQTPWNIRRQLEVVFSPMKKIIDKKIEDSLLIGVDDQQRRTYPAEYQADRIIELFFVFSSRSEKFDSKQVLSENFQRLDMIESMSKGDIFNMFIEMFKNIVKFDINLSECDKTEFLNQKIDSTVRFKEGKDIFTSQPAMVGLTAALAQKILGRPGNDYEKEKILSNFENINSKFQAFNNKLSGKDQNEICTFIDLEQLNEIIEGLKGSKVGDIEREYFKAAFQVLIDENFEVENLTVCWKA
jgi:hypothetical protein